METTTYLQSLLTAYFPEAKRVNTRLAAGDTLVEVLVTFDQRDVVLARGDEFRTRKMLAACTPKRRKRRRLHWGRKH